MGIVARQSFWNSVSMYMGLGLAVLNNIIIVPWVFGIHPEEEWGLVQYMLGIVLIMSPIVHLGLPNSMVRFMPYFREKGKPEFLFLISLITTISFSVITLAFLAYFFYFRPEPASLTLTTRFLPLVLVLLAGNTGMAIFESYAKAHFRTTIPVFIKEFGLRFTTTIILLLYGFTSMKFEVFLGLFIGAYLLKALIMMGYVLATEGFSISRSLRVPPRELTRSILIFTLFSFLGGQTWSMIAKIDVVLIKQFIGLKAVAIYSIPFYAGSIISAPAKSIVPISYTLIAEFWKSNSLEKIRDLYRKTALTQLLISGFLFLALWLNIDLILLVLGPKFGTEEAKWVFFFVALGQFANSGTGVNGQIISASQHFRYDLYIRLVLLTLTVVLQVVFIQTLGIIGAALGAGISLAVYNMTKVLFLQVKYQLHPFSINYLYGLIIVLIPLLSMLIDPYVNNIYVRVIIRMAILGCTYFIGIYVFRVSHELRTLADTVFRFLRLNRD